MLAQPVVRVAMETRTTRIFDMADESQYTRDAKVLVGVFMSLADDEHGK